MGSLCNLASLPCGLHEIWAYCKPEEPHAAVCQCVSAFCEHMLVCMHGQCTATAASNTVMCVSPSGQASTAPFFSLQGEPGKAGEKGLAGAPGLRVSILPLALQRPPIVWVRLPY